MQRKLMGLTGTVGIENDGIRLAWAALMKGAAFDDVHRRADFHRWITEALSSIEWTGVQADGPARIASGSAGEPTAVMVDRKLQEAIEKVGKDGLAALVVSARAPGADMPCGGMLWTESVGGEGSSGPAGPLSCLDGGLCMWAQQGGWCVVAECAPSDLAAIAEAVNVSPSDKILDVIVCIANEKGIGTLLAVADATGVQSNTGGVACIAEGSETTIRL